MTAPAVCLVTGAAGFIGGHLAERLLADGHSVIGLDRFSDYYNPALTRDNAALLARHRRFRMIEADLSENGLDNLLDGVDVVFHLAAQAGVRRSWGGSFGIYVRDNIVATQRLLESARGRSLSKFVYASTSSVYGDAESFPTIEGALPRPVSPYGVTKLAAEHMCNLYHRSFGVPTVSVRYFTVYGPRQRPDMAFNRFIEAIHRGEELTIFGDGHQTRDFTFVADAVDATEKAAWHGPPGEVFNVGGGSRITLAEVLPVLEELVGRQARVRYADVQKGDARDTAADIARASEALGYRPTVQLRDGLAEQVRWQMGRKS